MKKFKSFEDLEEPGLQGSWSDSYADLMSLLVCFFAVLLSASVLSAKKLEKVSEMLRGKTHISTSLDTLEKELHETFRKQNMQDKVDLVRRDEGLDVILRDTFLFPTGTAKLTKSGQKTFQEILLALGKMPKDYRFSIEGHTDDRKVASDLYPSNWHLSTARALAVLELFLQKRFAASRLRVQGFADQSPMVANRDFNGVPIHSNMAKNRRVVIRVR